MKFSGRGPMLQLTHILTHQNPQFKKCPGCNTVGNLHKSRARNTREQIIKKITFYKIYRCKSCGWRGMLPTIAFTSQSLKTSLVYLILIAATILIVRFMLARFIPL